MDEYNTDRIERRFRKIHKTDDNLTFFSQLFI